MPYQIVNVVFSTFPIESRFSVPKEVQPPQQQPVPVVAAITSKMLEKMRGNPAGDWKIENVETLCRQVGLECEPPRGGGSHFKTWSDHFSGILTIPAKRPIKTIYIKRLIALADAHVGKATAAGAKK
jgi:hypothetical protein